MKALLFLLLGFAAAAPTAAQPAPPRPVEHFARLPFIVGPKLSPDGARVAAQVATEGRQMLAIFSLTGGAGRLALVAVGEVDLNWWDWVNDDYLIAGVGGTDKLMGVELYFRRAVSISADGKQIRTLMKGKAGQNADDVIWAANDGTPRIVLAMQTPMCWATASRPKSMRSTCPLENRMRSSPRTPASGLGTPMRPAWSGWGSAARSCSTARTRALRSGRSRASAGVRTKTSSCLPCSPPTRPRRSPSATMRASMRSMSST